MSVRRLETYQHFPKIKVIKISILTPKIMDYISSVQALSNRKISKKIQEKYSVKVSHVTVGKYKKSLLETPTLTKITENISKKSTAVPRRRRFVLSVDTLKQLLDKNPNHYWHDYVEEEFIGKNGKAGKLRSDFQKLCEFLRDVT